MHINEGKLALPSGASINYRLWQPPENIEAENAVLLFHGIESHSGWFADLAPFLVAHGIALYAPDRSGWGSSPGVRGHLDSYNQLLDLTDGFHKLISKKHSRVHLAGLSWGGKMALYVALRRPYLFESLTLISPGLVALKSPSFMQKAQVALGFATSNLKRTIPIPINDSDFTSNSGRAGYIRTDAKRVKAVTASFCIENLKMESFINEHIGRLKIPAQLLLAGNDKIVDNHATRILFEKAGNYAGRILTHEDAEHSLVFETPERTANEMSEWIDTVTQPTVERKTIAIMGAGAVGSTVGGLLALGGHDVTLIGRQAHADKINKDGLKLTLGKSEYEIKDNLSAVTSAEELKSTPHLVIICVKSFDTAEACADLKKVIGENTIVLSLQNGLHNEDIIRQCLPEHNIVSGSICGYLSFEGPGHVCLANDVGGIAIGIPENGPLIHAESVKDILGSIGLEVTMPGTAKQVKWSKLMLNVAFNAINALTGLGTSPIMSNPKLGKLAVSTFAECAAVMKKMELAPVDLPGYPVSRLAKVMSFPAFIARRLVAFSTKKEAVGKSSMAQDFLRQRGKSEIMEINGEVVKAGEELGIKTPANSKLIKLIEAALQNPVLLETYTENPEKLCD